MKLNQSELQAMACKVHGNLEKLAQLEQDKLNAIQDRKHRELLKDAKKYLRQLDKTFKALPPAVRELIKSQFSYHPSWGSFATKDLDIDSMVKKMRKDQITVKVPRDPQWDRYKSTLFNEMTIAQIDSDNVDDMLNKVARRYVKTPGAGATS